MTQIIPVQAVANQRLTTTFDNDRYELTIKEINGVMGVTVVRNAVAVYTNIRIVAGGPIIPYRYQETGNFIFETQNNEIPYYTKFGDTQFLIYASPDELARFRRG